VAARARVSGRQQAHNPPRIKWRRWIMAES
jgi:hypothetical protein